MTKIAVVDNEILLTTLLRGFINSFEDCQIILEVANGKELIDTLEPSYLPDLVFLDISMPVMDGYKTTEWLTKNYPEIKVVILTSLDSEMAMEQLFKLGARGFIKKDEIRAGEIHQAITETISDGYYYSGSKLMIRLLKNIRVSSFTPGYRNITAVEMKFLRLACTGMTYQAIANEMGVSPRTVDGYRENLFIKLNVKSRVELALYAVKMGINQV